MDFAEIFLILTSAYTAYKARKAAGGDDAFDAVIEAIMPELSKYFALLFKESDDDGLFAALNKLVLGLYHYSGDTLQFAFRLMAHMKAEGWQSRWPWMASPLLIFLKGYFEALEKETSDKPKPTADEIKAAANKVAAEAKKAASDLKSKFDAAKEAVKGMHIPHFTTPPHGGPMNHAPPPPPSGGAAAGGTGDKKSWGERFSEMIAMLPALKVGLASVKEHLADMGESADKAAGQLACAIIGIATAMVLTGLAHGSIVVGAPKLVWTATVVFTLLWGLLPLCFGVHAVWDSKTSGFAKLASAGTAILLTGGVSSLVIAVIDGLSVLSQEFSWVYVASGLAAIVAADFTWRIGDLLGDAVKAITRLIPDGWEADWMKRGTIGFRKAMFTIAVAYSAYMFLVGLYAQWEHTLYGIGAVGMLVLCLLMATYGYSRVSLTANDAAADLNAVVTVHRLQNLDRFYWAATGLSLLLLVGTLGFNAIVPPTPNASGELPSYAARWKASRLPTIGDSIADKALNAIDPGTSNTCSPQVEKFVDGIQKGDCEVVLRTSSDTNLLSLCNQAMKCGAVNDRGIKISAVRKVGSRDAGSWWWFGVPAALALVLGLMLIFRKESAATEKKEEGKKPAAH